MNIYVGDDIKLDKDNYVSNMSIYDLIARNCTTKEEYISKSLEDFKIDEDIKQLCINKINYYIPEANKRLSNVSPTFSKIKWKICLFNGEYYENGMSHTRFDIIFLPISISGMDNLTNVLMHEKIHLLQRLYPNDDLIKTYMKKYTKYKKKKDVSCLIRANPDTDDFVYINKNGKKMFCEYRTLHPTNINDISSEYKFEHPYEEISYELVNIICN